MAVDRLVLGIGVIARREKVGLVRDLGIVTLPVPITRDEQLTSML